MKIISSLEENKKNVGYSRIPVFLENVDNVKGFVCKNLLAILTEGL